MYRKLIMAGAGAFGLLLAACSGGAFDTGVNISGAAGTATAALLSPADRAAVIQLCQAAAPVVNAAASPGLPAPVTQTATYPAAYCNSVINSGGQLPATTTASTLPWLKSVISVTQQVAKVAGVVLPVVLQLAPLLL